MYFFLLIKNSKTYGRDRVMEYYEGLFSFAEQSNVFYVIANALQWQLDTQNMQIYIKHAILKREMIYGVFCYLLNFLFEKNGINHVQWTLILCNLQYCRKNSGELEFLGQ